MDIARYPAQEPFNENAAAYHEYLIGRAKGFNPVEASYGEDPYQTIGVFPADKPDGRVLLFFHGGGWTNGYKEWMYFMAPALNALGITFVSAGYRLAPTYLFPESFVDCAKALDWLVRNASNYGGDPDQIFLSGHSAGGHYAALLAVTDEAAPGLTCASRIRGCAPISGIYYFGDGSGMAVRPRFLGPVEAGADQTASPINYVRAKLAPFLLAWGEEDFPHLRTQAKEMLSALQRVEVSVDWIELAGCNHFTASYAAGDVGGAWPTKFDQWTKRLLK